MLKSLRTPLILTNTFTSTGGFAGLVAMTSGGTLSWGHLSSAPGAELPVCMCHLGPHGNPRIDVSRINSKSALRPSLSWWATLRKGAAMPLQVNRGSRGENLRVFPSSPPPAPRAPESTRHVGRASHQDPRGGDGEISEKHLNFNFPWKLFFFNLDHSLVFRN